MKTKKETGALGSLRNQGISKMIVNSAICLATALVTLVTTGCEKNNNGGNDNGGGSQNEQQILFNGNEIGNGNQEFKVTGNHIIKKGTYILKGWVYVTDGSVLTIEPGTVIKGDIQTKAAIIVERGGKIMAQGSVSEPIIFTSNQVVGSRKPGDWGGIILCGKARNNKTEMIIEGGPGTPHGGNDDSDNSGILSYVRIEFAGYPFNTDQEINGLTLGSVGKGTKIDHIQVSYSNDDSYEWFGGCVNAKYLIAYHGWDDDFDTDNGFSGKLQFLLSVRNPKLADVSVSNGFESDNEANGTAITPITSPVFSNLTVVGPISSATDFENTTAYINGGVYNPNNGSKLGQFQSAIQIRRSSQLNCYNSLFTGFPVGIIIENDKGSQTQEAATVGKLSIKNIVFAQMGILGSDQNKSFKNLFTNNAQIADGETRESFSAGFFKTAAFGNIANATFSSLALDANYAPQAGSILLGKSNLFTDSKLSDPFFEQVNYIGAFKSNSTTDNWAAGWTNFDPQNTNY
ncbi:MAG: hypothetical protein RSC28_06005 [Bacteroidales bacterium]